MEIQELLVDLEAFRKIFTTEQNLRHESLESKCPGSEKIVSLVEWLNSTSFTNESSLCKNNEWLKNSIRIDEESTYEKWAKQIATNY